MPKVVIFKNQILHVEPKPKIRVVKQDQSPSEEMRKWLLEGHKNEIVKENKIVF